MGNPDPLPGPNELIDRGGGSQTSMEVGGKEVSQSYAQGKAGLNIARVEFVLTSGTTLQASLESGLVWPVVARPRGVHDHPGHRCRRTGRELGALTLPRLVHHG